MAGEVGKGQDHLGLYEAILARQSVRRYDQAQLDPEVMAAVDEIVGDARPLVHGNLFHQIEVDVENEDFSALGGYGRFVTPPHYLVPYIQGDDHLLADLGYRLEQIAVRLARIGVGSCFIGALHREDEVRRRFGLPAGARVAAFLIFGRPATGLVGRGLNTAVHTLSGGGGRMAVNRVFFADSFDQPSSPPAAIEKLVEAGRAAPSAVNAQPWRFLWREGRLHLFVTRENRRYGGQPYHLHDGGLCMANVALALEALGLSGRWIMYEGMESDIPSHPEDLQPLAWLRLGEEG